MMDATTQSQLNVKFVTKQEIYAVPDVPYAIKSDITVAGLNTLLNGILKENNEQPKALQFDFLVCGEFLRTTLSEFLQENSISTEETLEIEYVDRQPAPEPQDCLTHDDWVAAVHCMRDWIITGCYDHSLHIWTVKGKHKLAIPGHVAPVKAVAWVSITGSTGIFVSGALDETAMIWEWDMSANSVELVKSCTGHDKGVECVSVSADGARFATGSWDNTVKIWNSNLRDSDEPPRNKRTKTELSAGGALTTLSGHREAVSATRWLDQNTIASSSWDHTLKLWDCELGGVKQEIVGNKAFFDADYSPINQMLVTASADRHVRLYDPRSTESIVKSTLTSHKGWVQSVRWSTDRETLFISGSYDNEVKMWDIRSPRAPLFDLSGHENKVMCCDWSNPQYMLAGGCDSTLRIFKSKHQLQGQ